MSPLPVCANTDYEEQPPEGGCKPTHETRIKDRDDWMLDRQEFLRLEEDYGPHTLDGCCDEEGLNSHVRSRFCSKKNSFLHQHLQAENVWLNPTFSKAGQFIQHYLNCKLVAHKLRVTLVVPVWQNAHWLPLLRNFRLVKSFPRGSQLFTRPAAEPGQRIELGPTPLPVSVYRDRGGKVEFLPALKRPRRNQEAITVELIISQKGRILCKRAKDGVVHLPAKSGAGRGTTHC